VYIHKQWNWIRKITIRCGRKLKIQNEISYWNLLIKVSEVKHHPDKRRAAVTLSTILSTMDDIRLASLLVDILLTQIPKVFIQELYRCAFYD
jgi:hypothetical protein